MRQRRRDGACNRQTAQTRVEYANGARVPGQILDIGHYLTRFSLEKIWLSAIEPRYERAATSSSAVATQPSTILPRVT